jgi:hypothetical protein
MQTSNRLLWGARSLRTPRERKHCIKFVAAASCSKTPFARSALAVAAFCTALILAASPGASATTTETVLYAFPGYPNDGADPDAGLIADTAGNLYGTTYGGGASGNGVGSSSRRTASRRCSTPLRAAPVTALIPPGT